MKLRKDRKETTPQPEQTLQGDQAQMKEKRRLSGLFGSKKRGAPTTEHEPVITSPIAGNSTNALNPNPSLQNSSIQDSAYASSEPDVTPGLSRDTSTNVIPVENHGQIPGVSAERDLTLNKLTGDVTDDSTGEVVTTTPTTTTTTTTTTVGGKPVSTEVAVVPESSTEPVNQNFGHRDSNVSEMPDNAVHRTSPGVNTPVGQVQQPVGSVNNAPALNPHDPIPNVPQRSPNRRSRDLGQPGQASFAPAQRISEVSEPDPVSPIQGSGGANFSYPNRAGGPNSPAPVGGGLASHPVSPTMMGGSPPYVHSNAGATDGLTAKPQQNQSGTFANLKAAAKGIHGVGETLRGTLNSEMDNRFPRKNADKAAAANAKNQSVLQTGQREMEGVRVER